jgi:hypothetical protein
MSSKNYSKFFTRKKQHGRVVRRTVNPDGAGAAAVDRQSKYEFPIVFYIVTYDTLSDIVGNAPHANINLNAYINIQTQECFPETARNPNVPFLSNRNEVCFLFMRWPTRHHFETLYAADRSDFYNTINDYDFLNKEILGHAKVVGNFDDQIPVRKPEYLGIYNVCRHKIHIRPEDQTINPRDVTVKIGIDMFTALLTGMEFLCCTQMMMQQPEEKILWLGIDIDNSEFDKVAYIYTISGFSNPTISNIDYAENPIGRPVLQLTRPLLAHASSHLKTLDNFNQVMNFKYGTRNPNPKIITYKRLSSRIIQYRFSFDRSCITTLHMFPFLSFNDTRRPIGIHEVDAQRETGGSFVIVRSIHDPVSHSGHDVLVVDTVQVSPSQSVLSFNVGTSGAVDIPYDEATFHTHPITNYFKETVQIGTPSAGDFNFYAYTFIYLYFEGNRSFKFSLVSTIEGVYIISLHPNGIQRFFEMAILAISLTQAAPDAQGAAGAQAEPKWVDSFMSHIRSITDEYEYPYDERAGDIESILLTDGEEAVLQTEITKYMDWFNAVNNRNGTLFNIEFITWDKLNTRKIYEVSYLESRIKLFG